MLNSKKFGFSLPETLLGLVLISLVGISVFMQISSANKTGMAAYYRALCENIADDTAESLRLLGYDELNNRHNTTIAGISIDSWNTVKAQNNLSIPFEAGNILRKVSFEHIQNGPQNGLIANIKVKPGDFIVRGIGEVVLKIIIPERAK